MKKIFYTVLALFCLSLVGCDSASDKEVYMFSYFKGNGEDGLHLAYSYDGYDWKTLKNDSSFLTPQAGFDKLMRDPCIIKGPDGLFHMVWTTSWTEKGIGYASSKDLVNWSEQKYIGVMAHEADAKNCWAPELFWDEGSSKYYIFWSTTIPGRFPDTDVMDESGQYGNNHRIYYTSTEDFESFSETTLMYDRGFNVIDATIQHIGSTYYMILKNETDVPESEKNIRVATSDVVYGGYSDASAPITGDYWAEGPTALFVDGRWIVYFDKYRDHQMGAVASSDLMNWEDISDSITFPLGTRHGTAFMASEEILKALLK